VGLINRGETAAAVNVTWKSLGIAGKKIQARDLWAHQAVSLSPDGYTATVPTHGIVMLKISAK
jgi:alpha-galactosidase